MRITREGSWPPSVGITTHASEWAHSRARPAPLPLSAQKRLVRRDAGDLADEVVPRAAVVPPATGGRRQRPSRCHVQCFTHGCVADILADVGTAPADNAGLRHG